MDEIPRVLGAELGFVDRQRADHSLDLAQREATIGGHELVDTAGERKRPALVKYLAGDRDLELGLRVLGGGAFAQLPVPLRAELGAPQPLRAADGVARAEREVGEFADTQACGALVEVELHGKTTTRHTKNRKRETTLWCDGGPSFSSAGRGRTLRPGRPGRNPLAHARGHKIGKHGLPTSGSPTR